MKYYISIIITLFTLCFNISCKTLIKDKELGITNDIVGLYGILNPNHDSITIALSLFEGISNNKKLTILQEDLANAELSLEHNGQTISLQYLDPNSTPSGDNGLHVFYASVNAMPIIAGETYTVRAKKTGKFDLSATTTVPNANFDFSFSVEEGKPENQYQNIFKLEITDPEEDNFYRIFIEILNSPTFGSYMPHNGYTDDKKKINNKMVYTFSTHAHQTTLDGDLNVCNVTESLYRYAKSIENGGGDSGNPFAEPSSIYTNIEGGYGVFGAQNGKAKPIE